MAKRSILDRVRSAALSRAILGVLVSLIFAPFALLGLAQYAIYLGPARAMTGDDLEAQECRGFRWVARKVRVQLQSVVRPPPGAGVRATPGRFTTYGTVDGRLIRVLSDRPATVGSFTGILEPRTGWHVWRMPVPGRPAYRGPMLYATLNDRWFDFWETVFFAVMVSLFGASVALAFRGFVAWRLPTLDPVIQALSRHGQVESVLARAEADLASDDASEHPPFVVGREWLLWQLSDELALERLHDLTRVEVGLSPSWFGQESEQGPLDLQWGLFTERLCSRIKPDWVNSRALVVLRAHAPPIVMSGPRASIAAVVEELAQRRPRLTIWTRDVDSELKNSTWAQWAVSILRALLRNRSGGSSRLGAAGAPPARS